MLEFIFLMYEVGSFEKLYKSILRLLLTRV